MDGLSVAEASRLLGVPAPRIYRAAAREGLGKKPGAHVLVPPSSVAMWLRRWGWLPDELRRGPFTREEVFVLAALSRSPLGLRSARSVARRSGVTPTTATKALASLEEKGLVRERVERVIEGEVTDIPVWRLGWRCPAWRAIATAIGAVALPARAGAPRHQRSVPARFAHLFWNEDTSKLDVERDGVMIADRILRSSDAEAIAWAGSAIQPANLRRVRRLRNTPPRVAALGDALAGGR